MSRLNVVVDAGRLHVAWPDAEHPAWEVSAEWRTPTELAEALATLPLRDGFPRRVSRCEVLLQGTLVQRRTLRAVPPLGAGALHQMLELHQGRYFRRNGHPLVTGGRRLATSTDGDAGGVLAVAADAQLLDAIAEGLGRAGSASIDVRCARTDLHLEPPRLRTSRAAARQKMIRVLLAVAISLWMAVPAVHFTRLLAADRKLRREIASMEAPATALRGARRAIDQASAQVAAVEESGRRRGLVLAHLERLVSALPDSAYLGGLAIDQLANGYVTGAARPAALLIAAIDRSGWPSGVSLEGEPTPEGTSGWERFAIRLGTRAAR